MKIGMVASPAHVMSNKNITDKKACLRDITKQNVKDTLVLAGTVAGAGTAAVITTGVSNKAAGFVKNAISNAGKALSKVNIDGKNLKEMVKNSKLYTKFSSLPTPAKAGIMVATAASALIHPLWLVNSVSKGAKIEGNYEVK